jgi:hypothetical protein
MAADIDEASFVLGELKGRLAQIERTQTAIFDKLDNIEKSVNHIKVKAAGTSATVAIIITLVITFFTKTLKLN